MGQKTHECIWLEVSNVRIDKGPKSEGTESTVFVQLKGDRSAHELQWWPVLAQAAGDNEDQTAREIFRALDSKRTVLAGLGIVPGKQSLHCRFIRIQFSDSANR